MTTKGNHLGELEELVLIAAATLGDGAYGVSVKQYLYDKAGREVNISAVHEVLKRLERKGFFKSSMGGATNERGGRRKRYFQVTSAGRKALEEAANLKIQLFRKVPDISLKLR
jgi:DNA-binding PadR family transcriptional regulator